jgi:hypothetical protein
MPAREAHDGPHLSERLSLQDFSCHFDSFLSSKRTYV